METVEWPEFYEYITEEERGHFWGSHGILTQDARQLFDILDGMDNDANHSIDLPSFISKHGSRR